MRNLSLLSQITQVRRWLSSGEELTSWFWGLPRRAVTGSCFLEEINSPIPGHTL